MPSQPPVTYLLSLRVVLILIWIISDAVGLQTVVVKLALSEAVNVNSSSPVYKDIKKKLEEQVHKRFLKCFHISKVLIECYISF